MNNLVKRSICLCPIVLSCLLTAAQRITGVWKGVLHVPPKDLPIVFHIAADSTGKLIASFDSPDQNAFNLAISEVITKEDSVILMIKMLNGKYAGILAPDKRAIDGTWFQGHTSLPLKVTKTSDSATIGQRRRPQTPMPPFPYRTRDVEYWNADSSIRFGGTITYPAQAPGPFPAVLLITGSGQQDRDEMRRYTGTGPLP